MTFPITRALVLLGTDSLSLFAERRLTGQIFFLLGTQVLKVLLMALIDDSRSSLEALPYLLTKFTSHRTCLAILLMQLLQLMEGADDIRLVSQFLGSLTETRLGLQVFLEVILTSLTVQLQQVVELFDIQLIAAPQFVSTFGRHGLDFAPLIL